LFDVSGAAAAMLHSSSLQSPREVLHLLLNDCEATSREGFGSLVTSYYLVARTVAAN